MVTASTLADPYTVVSSAIGTLKGPLHGGAAQEVAEMLEEIGSLENVRPYLEQKLAAKEKLMDTPRFMNWPKRWSLWGKNCYEPRGCTRMWTSIQACSTKQWAWIPISSLPCLPWPASQVSLLTGLSSFKTTVSSGQTSSTKGHTGVRICTWPNGAHEGERCEARVDKRLSVMSKQGGS